MNPHLDEAEYYAALYQLEQEAKKKRLTEGMSHTTSFGQSQPAGINFGGAGEKLARGVYRGPGEVAGLFDIAADYTAPGMLMDILAPTDTTFKSTVDNLMGLAEVEDAYNTLGGARGFPIEGTLQGGAIDLSAPMVSDPLAIAGAGIQGARMAGKGTRALLSSLAEEATGAPWSKQASPNFTPPASPMGPPTPDQFSDMMTRRAEAMFEPKRGPEFGIGAPMRGMIGGPQWAEKIKIRRMSNDDAEFYGVANEGSLSILKNPSQQDISRWAGRDIRKVRSMVTKDGDFYVWPAEEAIHKQVQESLGIPHDNLAAEMSDVILSPEDVLKELEWQLDDFRKWEEIDKLDGIPVGSDAPNTIGKGQRGAVGYHGSPHKFTRFDHSKMGTGEGAQAYGWGTYIAENPGVAGSYKAKLSGGTNTGSFQVPEYEYSVGGKAIPKSSEINADIAVMMRQHGLDPKTADGRDWLDSEISARYMSGGSPDEDVILDYYNRGATKEARGSLYEVDLPDEKIAQMLDWDAPLSKQPESVKRALKQLPDKKLRDKIFGPTNVPGAEINGAGIYTEISDYMAGGRSTDLYAPAGRGQKEASEELRSLGIPGIKYFDGNSRTAGKGTRNFVVFDENDMTIKSRNGEPIPKVMQGDAPNTIGGKQRGAVGVKPEKKGLLDFDPRFDPRVNEQEKLRSLETRVEGGLPDIPEVSLADLEGRPFITSMSDRTRAGGLLTGINDVDLRNPVDLLGGQDYMFDNPGQVWASGDNPTNQIYGLAQDVKRLTGQDPLYMPWRMAPTAGDFAHMTGETMLSYADSSMTKKNIAKANTKIKKIIPGWKGIGTEESLEQYRSTSKDQRTAVKNVLDKYFRDEGGLGIGEARLAVTDPKQLIAPDSGLMSVGQIDTSRPVIRGSGHPSYPSAVPGEGLGHLSDNVNAFQLLPDLVKARQMNPYSPSPRDMRAMQMKPYAGLITEDILRSLEQAP